MNSTGEQFIPQISSPRIAAEHYERYNFAKSYCAKQNVLDIACGTGYGSFELSKIAESVIGVDISSEAVNYAKENYTNDNLSFIQSDCTTIDFGNKHFDVIVSFETIEHLDDNQRRIFYGLIDKYLKKDGRVIFSTPNKIITSPYTENPLNTFHMLEFTKKKLSAELLEKFEIIEWYGQRFVPKILTYKIIRKFIRLIEILSKKDFGFYSDKYSPVVSRWAGNCCEPRIMIVINKKK